MNLNIQQKKEEMKVLVVIMRKYQDRGIIKWAPFDALISYQDVLKTMHYERGKQDKPMLTSDQYETLDRTIKESIRFHKEVHITYYEDGYFKMLYGIVKKFDEVYKTFIFEEGFVIKGHQIIDVIC